MSINIEVVELDNGSDLLRTVWRFWQSDYRITLSSVLEQERHTRRHGWRTVGSWSRLDTRSNNIARPEPPESIKQRALAQLMGDLRFEKKGGDE